MKIPEYARKVACRLKENGFSAYFVGGCVRDSLLSLSPEDFDITTNATPNEIKNAFSDHRTVDIGIRHGTVKIISDGNAVEATTFRLEDGYSDHRKPDRVLFSKNLSDDLSRRDFTINAIAYSEDEGYIDLFGGKDDLENKIIRAIGDAERRFEEDALRILRALRFASRLGFEIEEKTDAAIRKKYPLLKYISGERIFSELNELLSRDYAGKILREYREIFAFLIPELKEGFDLNQKNPHHIYDVFEHTVRVLEATPQKSELRFAALFHDIGKPQTMTVDEKGIGHFYGHPKISVELARKTLSGLNAPNRFIDKVARIVEVHDIRPNPTRKSVHKFLIQNRDVLLSDYIAIRLADLAAQNPDYAYQREEILEIERIATHLKKSGAPTSIRELDISGDDISSLGIKGPAIGKMLSRLLLDVAEEKAVNEKAALIKRALELTPKKSSH